MKTFISPRLAWAGLLLLFSSAASAGISLGGTRIVLSAPSKEASILVKNQASQDIMIQSWMESETAGASQDVPFAITPSLSRLGGKKQQTLRILYYGEGLPTDKESVFRLSVQEIPQKAKSENTLQIALRQRIKVFYRPEGLAGTVDDAPKNLKWRLANQNGKATLAVTNHSAFHVSFGTVKLTGGGKTHAVSADMVGPGSTRHFPIKDLPANTSGSGKTVEFDSINDYGALIKHSSALIN